MKLSRSLLAVFALCAAGAVLVACSPIRTLNATVPAGTHEFTPDVAYGAGSRQQVDIYRPKRVAPSGGWPVVLFIYGGSWNRGDRASYRFVGEALAAQGIVALIADYRLYPETRYPGFLEDSALALAYTLREAERLGGNAKRVFVMGHSSGAYNAAMLALDPRWLAAHGRSPQELAGWVGLAGPYDFLPIKNPEVQPVFFHPDIPPGTQPIEHAGPRSPPAFLAAPGSDTLVNPERNTRQMADKLRAANVAVQLKAYERANHMTLVGAIARPLRWIAPVFDEVVAFVKATPPR